MNLGLKALLVASTIALVPLAAATPAAARSNVVVTFDAGNVAFAYRDGYWDRYHRWHRWHNRDERYRYRSVDRAHYYDYGHDRDHDRGWRDRDRYWNGDRDRRDRDRD